MHLYLYSIYPTVYIAICLYVYMYIYMSIFPVLPGDILSVEAACLAMKVDASQCQDLPQIEYLFSGAEKTWRCDGDG